MYRPTHVFSSVKVIKGHYKEKGRKKITHVTIMWSFLGVNLLFFSFVVFITHLHFCMVF